MQQLETEALQQLMTLIQPIQEMDEDLYEVLLKQTQKLQSHNCSQKVIQKAPLKANTTLSKRHKKYLYKMAKRLTKLVKQNDVSDEIKLEALAIVRVIMSYLDEADSRDKTFISEHTKQLVGVSSLALVMIATLYGIKVNKK